MVRQVSKTDQASECLSGLQILQTQTLLIAPSRLQLHNSLEVSATIEQHHAALRQVESAFTRAKNDFVFAKRR